MSPVAKASSLSSKLKITVDSEKVGCFSQKHFDFYMKYSYFVVRVLEVPSFQQFLCWMLKKENIEEQIVRSVYVTIFPLRRKNGKGLAGNCDVGKGKIRIYPKSRKFCRVFTQRFDKKTLMAYAGNRARAALIHELLHLKYVADEQKVRALTRDYFFAFTHSQSVNSSRALHVYTMIFKVRAVNLPKV